MTGSRLLSLFFLGIGHDRGCFRLRGGGSSVALGGRLLDWSLGGLSGSRHGHLLHLGNIFTIDEVHSVGVNDSTVIVLALNFDVVGD